MKNNLSGKNILITGASGFIGRHLANTLREKYQANVFGIAKSEDGFITKVDILHFSEINAFIQQNHIQICFHLAGASLVESGKEDPYKTFKTNIQGTLNILESARQNMLERTIIASSSHVYGNNKVPYFERYLAKPSRPYETSKTCADLIAQSYADTFDLPVFIPRFVNIYGEGDLNFSRLIPRTMRNVVQNIAPQMWGGDTKRDYLYIDDAIRAYVALAQVNLKKIGKNRIFNFGAGNLISVRDLVQKILLLSDTSLTIERIDKERELEIKAQYVSWQKAKRLLHWEPKTDLDTGLARTYAWYKKYFQNSVSFQKQL